VGQGEREGDVEEKPQPLLIASVQIDALADGPLEEGTRTLPLASDPDEWVVKPEEAQQKGQEAEEVEQDWLARFQSPSACGIMSTPLCFLAITISSGQPG
jgi:hypothetical protein